MNKTVYHKGNYKNKTESLITFGVSHLIPRPMCNSTVTMYSKRHNYTMVRNWKEVTCKLCLKKKGE